MNQWDKLGNYFDTQQDQLEINPGAADNILIAWPSLLNGIHLIQSSGKNLSALDYGCGSGGFCSELSNQGYSVVGCDSSSVMISLARNNVPNVSFYQCDSEHLLSLPGSPFDLITAVMVIQFIENVAEFFAQLVNITKSGSVIAFAVFNPDYVAKNHGVGKTFDGFQNPHHPRNGFLCLTEETRIPVFMREVAEYDDYIIPLGFKRIVEDKPAFSAEYMNRYESGCDMSAPEYLVLVYQKTS